MSVTSLARSARPIGLGAGLVFWFASLTPTLVPRGWIVQGVTSGACLAIGYGIGAMAERIALRAARRPSSLPPLTLPGPVATVAVALVVGVAGTLAWATWQDEARDLIGMSHLAWWEGPPMAVLSVAVAISLVWIGTMVGAWLRAAYRGIRRRFPAWLPQPATLVLAAALLGLVGGQVAVRGFVVAANVIYEALDQRTNPGIDQPTLATVSGSPSSLVGWETMGLWGRDFAAGVTSRDQLLAYHGADAEVRDPIRVFVGMRTAATIEERAAVAVRELERAGGFERSVIAVWVPSGSGWMDPNAARALEQLHAGDTAIVSTQYSYLPSFLSLVIDSSQAIKAGAVLFDAVRERWSTMPEHDRPRLIVFGASLGAGGAETPFLGSDAAASVANFASRADGALLVGSLGWNPILRQLTEAREPELPGVAAHLCGWRNRPIPHRRQRARRRHGLEPVEGALPAAPVRPGRQRLARLAVVAARVDGRASRPRSPARHRLVPGRLGRPGSGGPLVRLEPAVRIRPRLSGGLRRCLRPGRATRGLDR